MERADKIFMCLAALAVVALLIGKAGMKRDKIPLSRVSLSEPACIDPIGPAYLTSNLPAIRTSDDKIGMVTIGRDDATATGATAT